MITKKISNNFVKYLSKSIHGELSLWKSFSEASISKKYDSHESKSIFHNIQINYTSIFSQSLNNPIIKAIIKSNNIYFIDCFNPLIKFSSLYKILRLIKPKYIIFPIPPDLVEIKLLEEIYSLYYKGNYIKWLLEVSSNLQQNYLNIISPSTIINTNNHLIKNGIFLNFPEIKLINQETNKNDDLHWLPFLIQWSNMNKVKTICGEIPRLLYYKLLLQELSFEELKDIFHKLTLNSIKESDFPTLFLRSFKLFPELFFHILNSYTSFLINTIDFEQKSKILVLGYKGQSLSINELIKSISDFPFLFPKEFSTLIGNESTTTTVEKLSLLDLICVNDYSIKNKCSLSLLKQIVVEKEGILEYDKYVALFQYYKEHHLHRVIGNKSKEIENLSFKRMKIDQKRAIKE